jgi:hypothetical protein
MQFATWPAGFGFALVLTLAGTLTAPTAPAHAEKWCGFHQKAGSQVRCGYSSQQNCQHALDDTAKDVTCEPDPSFASDRMNIENG